VNYLVKITKYVYAGLMDYALTPQEALGESEVFLEFQRLLGQAARVDRSILVIGERGSGKELAAERLHFLSNAGTPFCGLELCGSFPGTHRVRIVRT
jgi:DNA-binding NtrC family response regulator